MATSTVRSTNRRSRLASINRPVCGHSPAEEHSNVASQILMDRFNSAALEKAGEPGLFCAVAPHLPNHRGRHDGDQTPRDRLPVPGKHQRVIAINRDQ